MISNPSHDQYISNMLLKQNESEERTHDATSKSYIATVLFVNIYKFYYGESKPKTTKKEQNEVK